ncbi:hypothetical protein DFH09DRAFT_1302149 [Mycena vulgaris]|nr:hypothetical protein DFH09DRAFT_1302149 [Mycena vulgaris]
MISDLSFFTLSFYHHLPPVPLPPSPLRVRLRPPPPPPLCRPRLLAFKFALPAIRPFFLTASTGQQASLTKSLRLPLSPLLSPSTFACAFSTSPTPNLLREPAHQRWGAWYSLCRSLPIGLL